MVATFKCAPIFMKFGTQNKSNKLTENLLPGTGKFDPKLKLWFHWFFN